MAIVRSSLRPSLPDGDLMDDSDEEEAAVGPLCAALGGKKGTEGMRCLKAEEATALLSASEELDSGMGSDEIDALDLGQAGEEICQVGNSCCSLPHELFLLPGGLGDVLSLETWNNVLSEQERFNLASLLPDMDQETFARTLFDLFSGQIFQFSSPLCTLLECLKGGLCDPRVVLYQKGISFLQRRRHFHVLREYHNSMIGSLIEIRDIWQNCPGYSTDERFKLLSNVQNQKKLLFIKNGGGDLESEMDSENREFAVLSKVKQQKRGKTKPLRDTKTAKTKGVLKVVGHHNSAKANILLSQTEASLDLGVAKAVKYSEDIDGDNLELQTSAYRGAVKGKKNSVGQIWDDEYHMYDDNDVMVDQVASSVPQYPKNSFGNREGVKSGVGISHKMGKRTRESPCGAHSVPNNTEEWTLFDNSGASPAKRLESVDDFRSGKSKVAFKSKRKKFNSSSQPVDELFMPDHGGEPSQMKIHGRREAVDMDYFGGKPKFARCEETESDSSEYGPERVLFPAEMKMRMDFDQQLGCGNKRSRKLDRVDKKFDADTNEGNFGEVACPVPVSVPGKVATGKSRGSLSKSANRKRNAMWDVDKHNHGSFLADSQLDNLDGSQNILGIKREVDVSGKLSQISESQNTDDSAPVGLDMPPFAFSSSTKRPNKKKASTVNVDEPNEYSQAPSMQLTDDVTTTKKKGKKKPGSGCVAAAMEMPDFNASALQQEPNPIDIKPQQPEKEPYIPITPSVHKDFTFSVIHLLSAVRSSMVAPSTNDPSTNDVATGNLEQADMDLKLTNEEQNSVLLDTNQLELSNILETCHSNQNNLPSLTVQEIIDQVKLNPWDPHILEIQEPLKDLVREVLKLFLSKSAPLGAKNWSPLVAYEKSSKRWCWVGPLAPPSFVANTIDEGTSPEAWGLPHKMLVKLVDAFANWLKGAQETLRQIGSLPSPPACMLVNYDEKERFRELRAQRSASTITPSSDEARAYFRQEEQLRYLIPDRAFIYTAMDGKKSIVAPLRRGGGKPTSKARDHFMLKKERPPHVTILCLVRDSAARLPGSIGTRADVCTLLRDSQYIVEDVTDAQVNQIVSGALDRLHYECDPCVQFDSDKKLWVYLHRDREEDDFDDDGTSSNKRWKKQKKDSSDPTEVGVGDQAAGGSLDPDCDAPLIMDPSFLKSDDVSQFALGDLMPGIENIRPFTEAGEPDTTRSNLGIDDLFALQQEDKSKGNESSSNDIFDDEAFERERAMGFLTTTLL